MNFPLKTLALKKSFAEKPLIKVLSKSKNAPMCAPDSPAIIEAVKLSVFEPGTISLSMGTEGVKSIGLARIMPCKTLILKAISSSFLIKSLISSIFGLSKDGIKSKFLTKRMPLVKNGLETASMRRIRPCQCISSPRNKQKLSRLLSSKCCSVSQVCKPCATTR